MPAVPIKLVKEDGTMTPETLAIVDSGCDMTMLPGPWAKILDIDFQADCVETPGNTAGGSTINFVHEPGIDAIFMGQKIHLQAAFHPGLPVILLGREDFFNLYKVSFDQRVNAFTVEQYV